jgi:hypothetical protein
MIELNLNEVYETTPAWQSSGFTSAGICSE